MKRDEIRHIVSTCLGTNPGCVEVGDSYTEVNDSRVDTSYTKLRILADHLGTTDINFEFTEGEPDYSEYTPGYPAHLTITIGICPED